MEKNNTNIINNRKIINGEDDGLMQIYPLKHKWAGTLYKEMLSNEWRDTEVPMQQDIQEYQNLNEKEKKVFERTLAFVSNADGFQTKNLAINMMKHITSPEVTLTMSRQIYEESLHVHAYSLIIETLNLNPDEIYLMYMKDKDLYNKNQSITNTFKNIADKDFKTGTEKNNLEYLKACCGNIILEGIYFTSAFLIFYSLRRNNKMQGSAEMIKFINRDEDTHLKLFINIFNTIIEENKNLLNDETKNELSNMFRTACEQEISWAKSCIKDGFNFLNIEDIENYIKFITDFRMKFINLKPIYKVKNPINWIDEYTQSAQSNFFETTVTEYSTGTLSWEGF